MRLSSPFFLFTFGLVALLAAPADAQTAVERGHGFLDAARFEDAVAAFDEALAADTGLDRDGLLRALRGRATANLARGETSAAERDLRWSLALDPELTLDRRAPPSLRRLLESARGDVTPLVLRVSSRAAEGAIELDVAVDGPPELVRAVEVHHDGGRGRWQTVRARQVAVRSSTPVRFHVALVGPGGAVIASDGSLASPRVVAPRAGVSLTEPEPETTPAPRRRRWPVALGVIGAIVVAGAVTAVVVTQTREPGTQLGRPTEVLE